jgi:hypothetical protein
MKTKKFRQSSILVAIAFLALLTSCNDDEEAGPYIQKTVDLQEYEALEIRGAMEVDISPNYPFDLRVEAPDNVMPYIEIAQSGNRLILDEGNNDVRDYRIIVKIAEDHLNYIELSGSGTIETDTIFSDNIEVELSGSGRIETILQVESLDAELSGSGQMRFYGESNTTNFDLSGSGRIHAQNLFATSSVAYLDGSGSIDLFASESLFARIDGSGVIRYWGNPPNTNLDVDGSGDIIDME